MSEYLFFFLISILGERNELELVHEFGAVLGFSVLIQSITSYKLWIVAMSLLRDVSVLAKILSSKVRSSSASSTYFLSD